MAQDLFDKYGTHLKLVGVVFVGIHVPLVTAGMVWLGKGRSDPESLMLSVLLGTVAGLLISVAGIWSVLRTRGDVTA
jgi:hypothetical protein